MSDQKKAYAPPRLHEICAPQALAKCKSCGASIRWAVTGSGRAIPIDLEAVPGGNIVLSRTASQLIAEVIKGSDPEAIAYRSHFATCPNADKHRKKKDQP